jgi:DNA-binding transcriptional MerR regulator
MSQLLISEVADLVGIRPSTVRYYERVGLVAEPDRHANGYRAYGPDDVERLRFITRAKGFGLTLDEIAELVPLLDEHACAPVQSRLRGLVDTKITQAHEQLVEQLAFIADLQRLAGALREHTPEGPCDETCGCTAERALLARASDAADERGGVDLAAAGCEPLVCTLTPSAIGNRVAEWHQIVTHASERETTETGVRVQFPRSVDVASLTALMIAESECCQWATYTLEVAPDAITLEVSGPRDARDAIVAMLGADA